MTPKDRKDSMKRRELAAFAAQRLAEARGILREITELYGDEKVSAAHPKQGVLMAMEKINGLIKAMGQVK
ncbi:TPA: hypothetical protein ACNIQM_002116 [Citrobacter werkmanii]